METIVTPKIQINEQLRTNAKGEIIEKSLLLNIREDNVFRAVQLYRQLNEKIQSINMLPENSDIKEIDITEEPFDEVDENESPTCPVCGGVMTKRRSKDGNQFWGCVNFRSNNCKGTRPIFN